MYQKYKKVVILYNDAAPIPRGVVFDCKDKKRIANASEQYKNKYETENEGFEVTIEKADGRSTTNKEKPKILCLVEKEGKKFYVDFTFDTTSLWELVKESKIINGKFQEKMFFVSNHGLEFIHENVREECSMVMRDLNIRDRYDKATKTQKREPGYSYFNLKKDMIYLGDFFTWGDSDRAYNKNIGTKPTPVQFRNIPRKISLYIYREDLNSVKAEEALETVSDVLLKCREYGRRIINTTTIDRSAYISTLSSFSYNVVDDIRAKGEQVLKNDVTVEKLDEILENRRKVVNDFIEEEINDCHNFNICDIKHSFDLFFLFATATEDLPHGFTYEQERFFKLMNIEPTLIDMKGEAKE